MMDLKNLMMLDEEDLEIMEEKNLPLVSAVCVESTNVSGKKSLAYAILPQKEEKENTGMISTKALKKLMRATGLAVPETIPTSNSGTDGSKAAELIQPYLGVESSEVTVSWLCRKYITSKYRGRAGFTIWVVTGLAL